MAWFKKTRKPIAAGSKAKASRVPEGLWVKCPDCSQVIYNKDLTANLNVCPKCAHHFRIGAIERLRMLFDGGWVEHDPGLVSTDPLHFVDTKPYKQRLRASIESTGLKDALVVASGRIEGVDAIVAAMEYSFIGGSMGVVVGEKIAGTPVAGAGHSLGEYSAYVTAGALKPADAAKLVRRRGELMQKAGDERRGTMAAVLGLPTKEVEAACAEASQQASVAVAANINAPDQTVISGDPEAVTRAGDACKKRGAKRVIALKVSGAFHSPLMEPAVAGLREALAAAEFGAARFPVIANATARPVDRREQALELLADQLTAPVRWVECMRMAAELAPGATFVEIGPGTVLSGLLKRIVSGATTVALGTADEVERFLNG